MLHASTRLSRRRLLTTSAGAMAVASFPLPGLSQAAARPVFTHGVQSGDVDAGSGMVWTRVDRPSRVMMEIATTDSFVDPIRLPPVDALPDSDLAIKRLVEGLPSNQDIFYRLVAADLADINLVSEPIVGHFRTAPTDRRSVRFAWSGDTVGQGWGIDATGMKTYAAIAGHQPDFFLHSGDTIYADGPLKAIGRPAGRQQVAERRADRGEDEGGRDPRRVPRPVEVQPDGRACAGDERRHSDHLPVGRP